MNATDIVTPTADTAATPNRAVWTINGDTVILSRRRLSGGNVRVRIEIRRPHVAGAQTASAREDVRDLPAAEANALFTQQLLKWNGHYRALLPAWTVAA